MATPTPNPSPGATAASNMRGGWQQFTAHAVRLFHEYGNWLVSISWKKFFLMSTLLLIASFVLTDIAASTRDREEVTIYPGGSRSIPEPPVPPPTPRTRGGTDRGKSNGNDDVTISIDKNGVRITPRNRTADATAVAAAQAAAASTAASAAAVSASASTAAASGFAATINGSGIEIKLPPGADSDAVREAVEEARQQVVEAIHDSQQEAAQEAREAREAARQAREEERAARLAAAQTIRHIRSGPEKPPFTGLALFFIFASAILKVSYKGTVQAEVKAAEATETAESEQLKRQVVEARMAAMQAQVEPHFLFNTLASIDHLIETDPPRASQMQKNLIALLRASMPTLRDSKPGAHNLGREMAVIRPYLAILKVRMEDRLQTEIDVPEGLLSAEFPSMMIQSLVENAIKHGLEPKAEGGVLKVKAEIVHGKLAVTVCDTGLGFGKAATQGTGIGLNNIRERLQLVYGNRASMTITENTPSGTLVTLTVPYVAQAREGAEA